MPLRPTCRVPAHVLRWATTLGAAALIALSLSADQPRGLTPAAASTAVDTTAVVDSVVRTTIQASATLSALDQATPGERAGALTATSTHLRAAGDLLGPDDLPQVPIEVSADARARLLDLSGRLDALAACAAPFASTASPTSPAPAPDSVDCHQQASPQDSAAARAAGAAVALLLPYGSLSVEQVSAEAASLATTAPSALTAPAAKSR